MLIRITNRMFYPPGKVALPGDEFDVEPSVARVLISTNRAEAVQPGTEKPKGPLSKRPEPEPTPEPTPEPETEDEPEPDKPKRGPGRPKGSGRKSTG